MRRRPVLAVVGEDAAERRRLELELRELRRVRAPRARPAARRQPGGVLAGKRAGDPGRERARRRKHVRVRDGQLRKRPDDRVPVWHAYLLDLLHLNRMPTFIRRFAQMESLDHLSVQQ
mgnify:CR=1 FL=1